ncbi:MAG: metabolite traffic protein EboE [Planctomycetaceae bacterium]|nr:metabolite traffic protein EboE [Planctomycetaceae bacterium]
MSISTLPLSYCTNVHPGLTVSEVVQGLRDFTKPVRERVGQPIAAGLWLADSVIRELQTDPDGLDPLRSALQDGDLTCYTLNAFPYGNFHGERVKEQVYLPDWTTSERLDYTLGCAAILAELMREGVEGSISTVPLGFKELSTAVDFRQRCLEQLLQLARKLDALHDDTGRVVRLAIEPEPLCVLETTRETLEFFRELFALAEQRGVLDLVQRHVGVCYDVCHQAVEFEEIPASIQSLQAAGIRINKVHITCALHLDSPEENVVGREFLANFVEPRYLHQTFARTREGQTIFQQDLTAELCQNPLEGFRVADAWRIHFHVPVDAEQIGPLRTTRPQLREALQGVATLDYAPHLEVETYTWGVLPSGEKPDLISGLTSELRATFAELSALTSS